MGDTVAAPERATKRGTMPSACGGATQTNSFSAVTTSGVTGVRSKTTTQSGVKPLPLTSTRTLPAVAHRFGKAAATANDAVAEAALELLLLLAWLVTALILALALLLL